MSERHGSAAEKTERILRTELDKAGWTDKDLERQRKGDPWKVRLATRLRVETTMTLKWIAECLHMGSWKHLNGRLYERRKSK